MYYECYVNIRSLSRHEGMTTYGWVNGVIGIVSRGIYLSHRHRVGALWRVLFHAVLRSWSIGLWGLWEADEVNIKKMCREPSNTYFQGSYIICCLWKMNFDYLNFCIYSFSRHFHPKWLAVESSAFSTVCVFFTHYLCVIKICLCCMCVLHSIPLCY